MNRLTNPERRLMHLGLLVMLLSGISTGHAQTCPVPSWYEAPPRSARFLIEARTARSADMQTAYDKAVMQGRVEIARRLGVWAYGIQEVALSELGDTGTFAAVYQDVAEVVVKQSVRGSYVVDRSPVCQEDGQYRVYVLVAYPVGRAQSDILDRLEGSSPHMVRQFLETSVGRQLDADVQAWDPREVYSIK